MIPRILELKNFLSYGEPVQRVDFTGQTLICLSGKNGHGKSALLDAMTWALWGQARKVSGAVKADDGLLHLGSPRMVVSLEFEIAQNLYRVRREFAKSYGKPLLCLDFETFDRTADKFVSLTDKTIRLTQNVIDRVIGLDYETFINSAFLRQGQSNEFSKKSAKERKHILTTILGLSRYDQLQQRALEKARTLQESKKNLVIAQEQLHKEIDTKPTIKAQQEEEKKQLQDLTTEIAQHNQAIEIGEKQKASLIAQKNMIAQLIKQQEEKKQTFASGCQIFMQHVREWRRIHAQGRSLPRLDLLQKQRQQLALEEKHMFEQQQKSIILQEQLLQEKGNQQTLLATIKQEQERLLNAGRQELHSNELAHQQLVMIMNQTKKQLDELEKSINAAKQEKQTLELLCKGKEQFEQEYTASKQFFEKRRTFYQTLVQRGNWLKQGLTELDSKHKIVHDTANPACPLCEQLLTVKRKQFLAQQITTQEQFFQRRLARIGTIIKKLKNILLDHHQQIQAETARAESYAKNALILNQTNEKIAGLEAGLKQMRQDLGNAQLKEQAQAKKCLELSNAVASIEKNYQNALEKNPELIAVTTKINALEQEKKSLSFDNAAYLKLKETLHELETTLENHHAIQQALLVQNDRRRIILSHYQELKGLKRAIAGLADTITQQTPPTSAESDIDQNLAVLRQKISDSTAKKDSLLHSLGSLEHTLQRIEVLEKNVEENSKNIAALDGDIDDYQVLASAMSKNGIQALLVEDVIPEIEIEANTLLSRLTDNQSQIFIESLRDLKSGGVKETLDIHISDAAGMRPYELFSGGEAFRIDFALRIAIAKLMARRAGTALQLLIIDEGFGSQDEEGLSHIMDCLYAIQTDFAKIIVVSHLTEFKQNFPVHFFVEKNPQGSIITIEER